MEKVYDIFISYRHDSTAAKAEYLQSLLTYAGFRERVSFDKDNLRSRFDVELLRRIDACNDFIVVLGEASLNDLEFGHTEHYKRLAVCSLEEFEIEEAKLQHTDFLRLEIARAISRGKNIIPIVPENSASYCFSNLTLPEDIALIRKYQAVFYTDRNDSFMFKDIIPKLIPKLISLPDYKKDQEIAPVRPTRRKLWWTLGIAIVLVVFSVIITWTYESKRRELMCDDMFDGIPVIWAHNISLKQLRTVHEIVGNMEYLKGGTFIMGASTYEDGRLDPDVDPLFETPQILQTVSPFYISKYEVTIAQWSLIMDRNYDKDLSLFPVTNVTYQDCIDFINKLFALTGLEFSLPSEAEWEYAAKGGDLPDYTKYSGTDNPRDTGWAPGSSGPYECDAATSGRYANGADLFDMSSNVSEWCETPFYLYREIVSETSTPEILDPDAIVVRGGNYLSDHYELTVTHRDTVNKNESMPTLGLRLVFRKIIW